SPSPPPSPTASHTLSLHDALPIFVAGIFPMHLQVGDEARHENKVDRTVTDDLIGDTHLAAAGVTRLRDCHGHAPARLHSMSATRSEEHTSELQSRGHLVCRLLLEK